MKEIKRFRDRLHYANISDIAKKEMINKKNMNRSVWKGSVIKSLKSKIFYQVGLLASGQSIVTKDCSGPVTRSAVKADSVIWEHDDTDDVQEGYYLFIKFL